MSNIISNKKCLTDTKIIQTFYKKMGEKLPQGDPYENDKGYTPEEIDKLNYERAKEEERLSQDEKKIWTGGSVSQEKHTGIGRFLLGEGYKVDEYEHREKIGGAFRDSGHQLVNVSEYDKKEAHKDGEARKHMSEEEWEHFEKVQDILRKLRAIEVPSEEEQYVYVFSTDLKEPYGHEGWVIGISDDRKELYFNRKSRDGTDYPDKVKIADITRIAPGKPR